MAMSWGKCAECPHVGDIYPCTRYDEASHHYTMRWVCRKCLDWEKDLPPRNHPTYPDSPEAA